MVRGLLAELGRPAVSSLTGQSVMATRPRACAGHRLCTCGPDRSPALWKVTRRAQRLRKTEKPPSAGSQGRCPCAWPAPARVRVHPQGLCPAHRVGWLTAGPGDRAWHRASTPGTAVRPGPCVGTRAGSKGLGRTGGGPRTRTRRWPVASGSSPQASKTARSRARLETGRRELPCVGWPRFPVFYFLIFFLF